MAEASRDGNYVPVIIGQASDESGTVEVWVNKTTHRMLVDSNATIAGVADDADFTAGTTEGQPILGVYESSPTSVTDGDVGVVGITETRQLKVSIENDSVGIGGGTEYTEDDAAAANPVGKALIGVRADSLAGVTSADGDNIAVRMTNNGELYVKHTDAIPITDNAGSITIDGTVTAELSATDNAVLDTIETNTDFGSVVGGGAEATALRVTLANDSTGVVTVDDGGGSLTVDGTVTETNSAAILADTANMDTNLGTVAGAVAGTEMQVDVVASLPAGTNAIGKLSANDGVDIGDVDVTSISAGTNLIGDVGIQGRATGGLSTYYDSDLDETAVAVKASAGTIYAIEAFNTTDAPLFLQLFNVASGSVTVGTTTPTNQWVIPGNANSDGAGFTFNVPQGIAYGTAITAACSTDSEGNTAPGAGACIVNIHYK